MCLSGKVIITYLKKNITPFLKHAEPLWEQEGLVSKAGSTLGRVAELHGGSRFESWPFSAVGWVAACVLCGPGPIVGSCPRWWMWKHFRNHDLTLWKRVIVQRSVKGSGFLDADFLLDADCGFLMFLLSLFSVFSFLTSGCLLPTAVCSLPARREVLLLFFHWCRERKEAWSLREMCGPRLKKNQQKTLNF